MPFLKCSKGRAGRLHYGKGTDGEVGPEEVEGFVEAVQHCPVMHLLELIIGAFGRGDGQGKVVNLLVELVQYLIGDDGLKAVDDAVLILLWAVVLVLVSV